MRRRRLIVHAATALILVAAIGATASPAAAEDYPSWDEVEAAKQSVAARAAEADRITAIVDGLEQEAGRLGDVAVEAAATAATAEAEHRAAAARARQLRSDADAAAGTADEATARFAHLSSVLARTGGADVALRLFVEAGDGGDVGDLLDGLSRGAQLSDLAAGLAARADAAQAESASVSAQADVAERERGRLAAAAETAADQARAAHEAAEARVAEQRQALDTLYAQLASLRDRSVELERRYRIGEQARLEAEARERAAAEAAENAADSGGGSGGDAPPPGMVVDPDAAKAYAAGAVGRFEWGSAQFECLVLLWTRESSWRADAYNASSGAYGIPQSLPGSKMAAAGADWRTNAATQIEWGLSYISGRYGAPCGAWAHSEQFNWY
ncbi:hypothetical protein [Agromyces sp. S2-1-8]|uniref:aggregation-promoting factor C-terminal-like domain-containing protein n=1 Tax=Agromyces sp. S2-1-8 TaxID=2897180 RepID=UPI001E395D24|nr:hypothetical protein [Agromyces sp. S2-1-8]MCD5347143.1 hypothetical protein [Agromyces sp. S2-1-8]